MNENSILPFSKEAKIAMANHIIECIDSHKQNLGVSNDLDDDGVRSVHVDTENMNESCYLDTVVSEAIKKGCEADGIRCGID